MNLPWPRIIAEGAIIVVSILLAFSIDTWWDERSERHQETLLLADLREDFEASQAHLEIWLDGNRRTQHATNQFLHALMAAGPGEPVSVQFEWLMASIGTPTYSPTDASLRAAIASGRIEILENAQLRKALATWQRQLQDTQEDELLVRDLVAHFLVPQLAETVRLGESFDFSLHTGWFQGDTTPESRPDVQLTVTTGLEGLMAQRVFYHTFVVQGLEDIKATQARILELVEKRRK